MYFDEPQYIYACVPQAVCFSAAPCHASDTSPGVGTTRDCAPLVRQPLTRYVMPVAMAVPAINVTHHCQCAGNCCMTAAAKANEGGEDDETHACVRRQETDKPDALNATQNVGVPVCLHHTIRLAANWYYLMAMAQC